MAIYFADDINNPAVTVPSSDGIVRPFKLTYATALATTAAAGFLASDILVLAPIPGGATLLNYQIDMQSVDSGSGATWDLGDTQVLSGYVSGQLSSTAQTTPASLATTFTLTLAASTSSFQTAGLVLCAGILIAHTGKSGSTLTGCSASVASFTIPAGSAVVEAGNIGTVAATGYANNFAAGQNAESWITPSGIITGTSIATAALVPGALPANEPYVLNTTVPAVGSQSATVGQIAPLFLTLRCHTSPAGNPTFGTTTLTGHVDYYMRGLFA